MTFAEYCDAREEQLKLELMQGAGQMLGKAAGATWQGMKNFGQGAQQGWQVGQSQQMPQNQQQMPSQMPQQQVMTIKQKLGELNNVARQVGSLQMSFLQQLGALQDEIHRMSEQTG